MPEAVRAPHLQIVALTSVPDGELWRSFPEANRNEVLGLLGMFLERWAVSRGERDRYLGPELVDRVERLPDASHWVHHDEAERVNQLLTDFSPRPASQELTRDFDGRRAPGPSSRSPRCCWPWPASHSPSAGVPGKGRPRRTPQPFDSTAAGPVDQGLGQRCSRV